MWHIVLFTYWKPDLYKTLFSHMSLSYLNGNPFLQHSPCVTSIQESFRLEYHLLAADLKHYTKSYNVTQKIWIHYACYNTLDCLCQLFLLSYSQLNIHYNIMKNCSLNFFLTAINRKRWFSLYSIHIIITLNWRALYYFHLYNCITKHVNKNTNPAEDEETKKCCRSQNECFTSCF